MYLQISNPRTMQSILCQELMLRFKYSGFLLWILFDGRGSNRKIHLRRCRCVVHCQERESRTHFYVGNPLVTIKDNTTNGTFSKGKRKFLYRGLENRTFLFALVLNFSYQLNSQLPRHTVKINQRYREYDIKRIKCDS